MTETTAPKNGGIKHIWNAVIQRNDGEVIERQVVASWDPNKVSTDSIARTACGEAFTAFNKQFTFVPISAQLVS